MDAHRHAEDGALVTGSAWMLLGMNLPNPSEHSARGASFAHGATTIGDYAGMLARVIDKVKDNWNSQFDAENGCARGVLSILADRERP